MKFRLSADITIYAENIDDVFKKLAEYYKALSLGEDVESIFGPGEIEIKPEN